MKKRINFYSNEFWNAKLVEPENRNKDGLRWIMHRFPIKGGISMREMMFEDAMRTNPFLMAK